MLKVLSEARLSKYSILSVVVIILGMIGGITHILPGKLPYFSLLIAGTIAIILQFNFKIFMISMGKMTKSSWFWVIPVALFTLFISLGANLLGNLLGYTAVANGALGNGSTMEKIISLIFICISLVGEEVITAAFTFPIFTLLSRKTSIVKAWWIASIIGALIFGLMHVNVYDFNMYQCLVATGLTRLPFNWIWLKANSLWGGIVTHIVYDLIIFIPMGFLV